jgi:hypothetical protein
MNCRAVFRQEAEFVGADRWLLVTLFAPLARVAIGW